MKPPEPDRRDRPGFNDVFAALPVAVVVVDPDDRIAHANALAEQLLNLSERLMIGQPIAAILPPPTSHVSTTIAALPSSILRSRPPAV
ncbi:PAS domain-containing protein [Sphingomonas aerolata]|uniref:PAS domain-containing protein n=1 Tax=Sphingomonas aerolata TaxID=185951 RepID=UPI003A5BAABE